jgi:hypothetical protein
MPLAPSPKVFSTASKRQRQLKQTLPKVVTMRQALFLRNVYSPQDMLLRAKTPLASPGDVFTVTKV